MGEDRSDESVEIMAGECIAVRLRTLNRAITALFDDALRPQGLRIGQLNLLVAIARMGTSRPGDLCRVFRMDKSTLSRDVEVMKRHGWLDLDDSGGGRSRPLKLTPKGRALLETVWPAWQSAQSKAKALLGEDGADAIARVVDRLWSGEVARP